MADGDCADKLAHLIETGGPISIARYMGEANAHYYATRDPLGAAGDFITAPEISQMFGELIGLWLADMWLRAGRPADPHYVELGPGRGTLAVDALRAMAAAGLRPAVDFVETSLVLRREQAARIADAVWHDDLSSIADDVPLLVVANEFFDALPVRQLMRTEAGWCENMVGYDHGVFHPVAGPPLAEDAEPEALRDAATGTVIEGSPARAEVARQLGARIAAQGGAALIFDYGHLRTTPGDTLQAVARHAFADPWQAPGTRDLTAHVDFEALASAAESGGARVHQACEQGGWLKAVGIDQRVAMLARAAPERAEELAAARERLAGDAQMGRLFKVLALTHPEWPMPAGFA